MKNDQALGSPKVSAESDNRITWRCAIKLSNEIFVVAKKQAFETGTAHKVMEGKDISRFSKKLL